MNQWKKAAAAVVIFVSVMVLGACADELKEFSDAAGGTVTNINKLNQAGHDLMEEERYSEAIVKFEEAIELIYKARPEYKTLVEPVRATETYDSPFNNISWAYYELGDYEKSLEYIDISLLILPNTDTEYINKGNSLYALGRPSEAMEQYEKALNYDSDSLFAHYGKGMIHYDWSEYRDALQAFNAFLRQNESDYDAMEMKVNSHIALGESEKALEYAEHIIAKYPDDYHLNRLKGIVLNNKGDYEEAKRFYTELAELYPYNGEIQQMLGEFYYEFEEYEEALAVFQNELKVYSGNIDVRLWLMTIYDAMYEYEEALAVYEESLEHEDIFWTLDLHVKMGDIAFNFGYYLEAADYYGYAAEEQPYEPYHYVEQLSSLYNANRNVRCIQLGEEGLQTFAGHSDISWYTGLCRLDYGDYEGAIQDLTVAAETDPESSEAWARLAYAYMLYGDESNALTYSDRSLELYSGNYTAEMVKEALKEKNKPIGAQIKAFFQDNYLYLDAVDSSKTLLAELDYPDMPMEEIASKFEQAKRKGDQFSFLIYGDEYDQLGYFEESDLEVSEADSLVYIRIPTFHTRTDDAFIDVIDRIEEPETKNLVLDLRGNGGGLAHSANVMLDALLPDYVTSMMIYRDGQTENYYSDPAYTAFRHIFILVDENSASASELLTLGLKSYLSNVTVVGRTTYGKGVGQSVFEDPVNKVLLYVVNFYWNVKQENISDSGIKPDVYVQGNDLESFMKPVRNMAKK